MRKTEMSNTGTDETNIETSVMTVLVFLSRVRAAVEPQTVPVMRAIMNDDRRSPRVEGRVPLMRSVTGCPVMSDVPRLRLRRFCMYFAYSGSACPLRSMP